MKKILSLVLFLMFLSGHFSFAQNIQIKGKVVDESNIPIEDMTVYLSKAKDSTLIQYTATNDSGLFSMNLSAVNEPSFLTFSLIGYQDYVEKFETLNETKDLETIVVKDDSDLLSEILIVTDAPIRVKNDTLEFNAGSFKVRPDANVEALLKELPGVEIDSDKKITVNGKEVSQILVNGKPFFNTDGSVALQNLPADLIKKVQVSDYKTKAEEFSGRRAKSDNVSINLTIDEENNKGLMGKIMAGVGSVIDNTNRYETSGLFNYFQGDLKISVLGMSNNINSTSFSMDELFDNMGGGRSQYFSFGGRSFRGNSGLTKTNMGGINYSDVYFKDLDINASYYINESQNKNNNRSKTINLLPEGDFITESESFRLNNNINHNANVTLEYKLNSTAKLFVNPVFSSSKNDLTYKGMSKSVLEDGTLLNESHEESFSTSESAMFKNTIQFNKKLGNNGQNFSLRFENDHSKTKGLGHANSTTLFYQDNQPDDIRKQEEVSRRTDDVYTLNAEFSQPINEKAYLDFGYTFDYSNQQDNLSTYAFDEATNSYINFNSRLSNQMHRNIITNTPYVEINYQNDKLFWFVSSGVSIAKYRASAYYMDSEYRTDRKFVSPYAQATFRYSFDRTKSLNVRYSYNVNNPGATQVLNYERLNNPLQTFIGNENLDQAKHHSMSMGIRNFNLQTRSGWSVFLSGNYYDSQIVSSTLFDENRKRTTTYENVTGAYSMSIFSNWNKSHKINEHSFRFGVNARASYGKSKEFVNGVLTDNNQINFAPRIYVNWDYGELLNVSPSYRVSYTQSEYNNLQLAKTDYVNHSLMLQTTSYWPENLSWGNDFSYNYNTNIAPGFKRNYFMWNTSLGYTFLEKSMTARVKVYDILNQNIGTSRSISSTSIVDQENTVLERYVMFSLTWKFDKFGSASTDHRNREERMGPHRGMRRR